MKKLFIFSCILASAAIFSGCGEKEVSVPDIALTMSFSDAGFVSGDGEFLSNFSDGDRIGLFAVENGAVVEEVNNLCVTASPNGESLVWTVSDASMLFPPEAVYYAYYPYQDGFSASVNPAAVSAAEFFDGLVSSWSLPADQSGSALRSADLMTGSASVSSGVLDIAMQHSMALTAMEFPGKVYRFTNTDYQIPDYSLSADVVFDDFVPYSQDSKYYYLVKPGTYSLSGSLGGEAWSYEGDAAAGSFIDHSEGELEVIEHQLQVGDFYLADGSLLSKDAPASEVSAAHVLGVVCQYNPDRIGEGEKEALGGVAHALVLASRVAGGEGGYMQYRFYTDYAIQDTDFDRCYVRDEEGEIGFPRVPQETNLAELCRLADANIDGYKATHLIYTERAEDMALGNYPGFQAVQNFAGEVGGPVEGVSTGWFMPAGGQYLDAVRNLCNLKLDAGSVSESGGFEGTMTWFDQGSVAQSMNSNFEKIAANQKSLYFDAQNGTMVSTEASPDCHRYIDFADYGWVDYLCYWKYTTTFVRPMLAF